MNKLLKGSIVFCFVFFTTSSNADVFTEIGTLQSLNTTITNANSGEVVTVVGDYYVLNGTVTGTAANDDVLLGNPWNQFMVWEPAGGAFTFSSIEVVLPSSGTDILDLSRISDALFVGAASGDDLVWTGSGNDIISGDIGNNIIDGGLGIDTVLVSNIADYTITQLVEDGIKLSMEERLISGRI